MQPITKSLCDSLLEALGEKQQNHSGPQLIDLIPLGANLGIDKQTTYQVAEALKKRGYILLAASMGYNASALMESDGWLYLESLDESNSPRPSSYIDASKAQNSIIGNQKQATINIGLTADELVRIMENAKPDLKDREILERIAADVRNIAEGNSKPSKSKVKQYIQAIQRNSWLMGPIASKLIDFLLSVLAKKST